MGVRRPAMGFVVAAFATGILVGGPLWADPLTPVGEPTPWHSWYQQFHESADGGFDRMRVEILSGGPFETPTFGGFAQGSWQTVFESTDGSGASVKLAGDAAAYHVDFKLFFLGNSSDAVSFRFTGYKGSEIIELSTAQWDGASWSVDTTIGHCVAPQVQVPLPSTGLASLAILGILAGAGALLRKRPGT
jgi:hypothetical protein